MSTETPLSSRKTQLDNDILLLEVENNKDDRSSFFKPWSVEDLPEEYNPQKNGKILNNKNQVSRALPSSEHTRSQNSFFIVNSTHTRTPEKKLSGSMYKPKKVKQVISTHQEITVEPSIEKDHLETVQAEQRNEQTQLRTEEYRKESNSYSSFGLQKSYTKTEICETKTSENLDVNKSRQNHHTSSLDTDLYILEQIKRNSTIKLSSPFRLQPASKKLELLSRKLSTPSIARETITPSRRVLAGRNLELGKSKTETTSHDMLGSPDLVQKQVSNILTNLEAVANRRIQEKRRHTSLGKSTSSKQLQQNERYSHIKDIFRQDNDFSGTSIVNMNGVTKSPQQHSHRERPTHERLEYQEEIRSSPFGFCSPGKSLTVAMNLRPIKDLYAASNSIVNKEEATRSNAYNKPKAIGNRDESEKARLSVEPKTEGDKYVQLATNKKAVKREVLDPIKGPQSPIKGNFALMYRRGKKKRRAFEAKEELGSVFRTNHDQLFYGDNASKDDINTYLKDMNSSRERAEDPKSIIEGAGRGAKFFGGESKVSRNTFLEYIKKQGEISSNKDEKSPSLSKGSLYQGINSRLIGIKNIEKGQGGMGGPVHHKEFNLKDLMTSDHSLSGKKLKPLFHLGADNRANLDEIASNNQIKQVKRPEKPSISKETSAFFLENRRGK